MEQSLRCDRRSRRGKRTRAQLLVHDQSACPSVLVYESNKVDDGNLNRKDSASITVVVKSPDYPHVAVRSSKNHFDKIEAIGKVTTYVEYT